MLRHWQWQENLKSPDTRRAPAITAPTSKVGAATIRRVEVLDGEIPVTLANEAAIRRAFEAAGIEFIEENGTGEGVRFCKPRRSKRK